MLAVTTQAVLRSAAAPKLTAGICSCIPACLPSVKNSSPHFPRKKWREDDRGPAINTVIQAGVPRRQESFFLSTPGSPVSSGQFPQQELE